MKELKALLDKYWNGQSETEEEKRLREELSMEKRSPEADFFRYLKTRSEEGISDPEFDSRIINAIKLSEARKTKFLAGWKVAAVIALLLVAALVTRFVLPEKQASDPQVLADTYEDPEKAFEETKKALLFISAKLNEGSSYTRELGKFSESQEKLKKD